MPCGCLTPHSPAPLQTRHMSPWLFTQRLQPAHSAPVRFTTARGRNKAPTPRAGNPHLRSPQSFPKLYEHGLQGTRKLLDPQYLLVWHITRNTLQCDETLSIPHSPHNGCLPSASSPRHRVRPVRPGGLGNGRHGLATCTRAISGCTVIAESVITGRWTHA